MEVLEGKTLEIHKSVPINVAVNAVYSKYSVIPLKNINFGPIQFNESKTRTFEIKNEGQFEFNYTLFDFNNEEFRKELLASLEKDRTTKLEALNALPVAGTIDPKKGKKEVKEPKK
jgi:hydrocephalus-inducing protein